MSCPYQQASLIQQALTSNKMRVAFLIGAGCPKSISISDGNGGNKPLIPDISGLTKNVSDLLINSPKYKVCFPAVLKRLIDNGKEQPNIEEILTHIRSLYDVIGKSTIDGLSKEMLDELDVEICKLITEIVNVDLPANNTPYHNLARWIGGIPRAYPVEIFTSNYDLLMEQAFETQHVPYFDGFVGSNRAFFDLTAMEQDVISPRWARLWKVHGSVNWWRRFEGGEIERRGRLADGARQMIHPSHLKYDESRRMPYLAMLDRLRNFLVNGQAVLITCGYSFADKHINDIIRQGLSGNLTAICFGLLYADRIKFPSAVEAARSQRNLSLLAADGGVLNGIEYDWKNIEKKEHALHGYAVGVGEMSGRTSAPVDRCKFLLGDFNSLGEFLAQQSVYREEDKGVKNASG